MSRVIAHDNLEEFADPVSYDIEEGAATRAPARFYGDLAEAAGGAVLEVACGTGLVALELAARGLDVTGADVCRPMLDHARRKARARGIVATWIETDARSMALGRGFDFIYLTGNAFQAFLTDDDQSALLETIARHLSPGGRYAFETRNPSGTDLVDVLDEQPWHRYVDAAGVAVEVSGTQRYDAASRVMHWTTFRRRVVDDQVQCRVSRIACRFTGVDELVERLGDHGFRVEARHGDFDGSPLREHSPSIVMVCRRH